MKPKSFLIIIFLITSLLSWGYNTSDTFYDNGIKYQVTSTNYASLKCKAIGYDKTICTNPLLVIPGTCHESKENYDFTVTAVEITIASPINSIEMQENITTATILGTYSLVKLPKSLTSFVVAPNNQRFIKFECVDGGVYSCIDDGHTLIKNGTTLVYHDRLGTVNNAYTVPDGIKSLDNRCFRTDSNLKYLTIGKDVTSITNPASSISDKLLAYSVAEGNTKFSVQDGVLFNLAGTSLLCYPRGKTGSSYTVPDGCTTIK